MLCQRILSSLRSHFLSLLTFPFAFSPGGILTVADDLLRNDGQKFLEMMESLADKRIRREKEAAESVLASFDDEEDDDEYDDEEDEEDEDDEDVSCICDPG